MASQNILSDPLLNDIGAKSSRLPESQSYGHINLPNSKAPLIASVNRAIVSTSDSEGRGPVSMSEVTLKQQLIVNRMHKKHSVGNTHSSTATAASLEMRLKGMRPSISSILQEQ